MENEIKAIITDLDGVIRLFPSSRTEEIEKKYLIPSDTIMSCAFSNSDLELVIRGKITDAQWRTRIAVRLSESIPSSSAEIAISEWSNYPGLLNIQVLETYRTFKKGRPFVLMTNATDKLKSDLKALGIEKDFDLIINSSELGYAKPEEQIYNFALMKLGLRPREVAFIDDSQRIVSKAEEIGFCSHHYTSYENFYNFCRSIL